MATKDQCLTNDKVVCGSGQWISGNKCQVNLSVLISCYGIQSDAKKFAKSIITTPVNVHYDNLNQTILLLEKYVD